MSVTRDLVPTPRKVRQPDLSRYVAFLPPELRSLPWRTHALDGKLLLFERDSGLNILLEGQETAHLRRLAPRSLLIAVTNACNLACPFCYRDQRVRTAWTYDSLRQFCREADAWGVLEVAFGGGEPLLFPRWPELLCDLYQTTGLALNFTTNGTRLTAPFLQRIAGKYGQIRLSLYEDNHWPESVRLLVDQGARFGVNWLITPRALGSIDATFARLLRLGVRDFLFIRYKGRDRALHLDPAQQRRLAAFVRAAYRQLGQHVQLKLDACWGARLSGVPRLFAPGDCAAGDEILSLTGDRQVKACSFCHAGLPFETMAEVRYFWQRRRAARLPAQIAGCARLPGARSRQESR